VLVVGRVDRARLPPSIERVPMHSIRMFCGRTAESVMRMPIPVFVCASENA
jgi:hypothetical protein